MDFFEHQEAARRQTGRLVLLFGAAVVGITAATYILVVAVLAYARSGFDPFDPLALMIAVPAAGGVIVLGSLSKLSELRAGGFVVAERLGGRLVTPGVRGQSERRLLNVVEEMAIASGVPVPPVYIMDDESAINAFAAGYSPSDAVIGVTRGCIEKLTRDELQGVIAHEFSHILNGDMRLNIRLMSALHGILMLSLIGSFLLRMALYSGAAYRSRRRSEGNAGLVLVGLGAGLLVIGSVGSFFGAWIKGAVSRQREFLADASAVQFTRNASGIADALKRIGGYKTGSAVLSPNAPEASHLFFGQAITAGFAALFATHPPLEKRIQRLEPNWKPESRTGTGGKRAGSPQAKASVAAAEPVSMLDAIGQPSRAHVSHARQLISEIPSALSEAAHEPLTAQAVIVAMLLSRNQAVMTRQLELIDQHGPRGMAFAARRFVEVVRTLEPRFRIPILDLSLPALGRMSEGQLSAFQDLVEKLAHADQRLELFEWMIQRVLRRHVARVHAVQGATRSRVDRRTLEADVSVLLSALAYVGGSGASAGAFRAGAERLAPLALSAVEKLDLSDLDKAIARLERATPTIHKRILDGCAAVIEHDGTVTVDEAELFRAVADGLDCPVPPMLPGQSLH